MVLGKIGVHGQALDGWFLLGLGLVMEDEPSKLLLMYLIKLSLPPSLPPAWVFGDPHLVTLDGHKYTFNGNGEFTLIRTQNNLFTMQGRMQQFSNVSATVLTAIAARELYSDTVMITNSRRGIDAYVNGERVDLSVIEEQEFQNVTVTRTNDSILSVEFSCGARISVRAENNFLSAMSIVLPPSFHGNSQGLLGVYNGDPTDDLLPENGITPLPSTSTRQRIHELFGLTCKWLLCAIHVIQYHFVV